MCRPFVSARLDIPLLVEAFLSQSHHFSSRPQPRFGTEAMQCLLNYDWPGNVRELKACVDYAVIHSKGERINPQDLPPELSRGAVSAVIEPMTAVGDERGRILARPGKNRRQPPTSRQAARYKPGHFL